MTFSKSLKYNVQSLLARSIIYIASNLSLETCHRLGSLIGRLAFWMPTTLRSIMGINIRLCFPQLSISEQQDLTRRTLIETGKTITETCRMWKCEKNELFSLIKHVHNEALVQNALNKQNGVILALPHIGSWELLGLYASSKYSTSSMYRKSRHAQLDNLIRSGRERFGAKLVSSDSLGIRALYKALSDNEIICILPDQEPSTANGKSTGLFAPFFGIPAYSMTLVSRLARKTNATVLIAYCKRLADGPGYEIYFSALPEEINSASLKDSVTCLNAGIEKCIRDIPEQYQWGYKRFRSRPACENEVVKGTDPLAQRNCPGYTYDWVLEVNR